MALNDVKIRSAKAQEKVYTLTDSDGLSLYIHPNGSKYWRFRFRFAGKQHVMAFGVYPEISLAEARERRDAARKQVALNIDPREQKREIKQQQLKEFDTFEKVARAWHADNKKWSPLHSERILKGLVEHLFPAIGKMNIADLNTRDLLAPIKAVEYSGRLEVAMRLKQRTFATFHSV